LNWCSDQISRNFKSAQISTISASPPYFFILAAASFNALASAFCFSLNALSSSSSTFSAPFACFNGFTLPPSSQSAVCKKNNSKYINSIIFFYLFEENYFYKLFFEENKNIHKIYEDISQLLYDYYKLNFLKICFLLIINNTNKNKVKINSNINNSIFDFIDIKFIEYIKQNFKPDLNKSNINHL
jgi:hypothetical protein